MTKVVRKQSVVSLATLPLVGCLFLACTDEPAEEPQFDVVASGAPCRGEGTRAPADDGCNTCVCERDTWACTEIACESPCSSGDTMPAGDGCNTCTCEEGQWSCTLRGCVCPQPVDAAEPCTAVVVYARDPSGGACCEYDSPCAAPEGWDQFYTVDECTSSTSEQAQWFPTCGDPVCGPDEPTGATECTPEQVEGAACDSLGALCDANIGCGANLVCATSDPRLMPGGCPISRARFKRDVQYLTPERRALFAQQLLETPLATFRYRGGDGTEQLGFILEDVEPSPSVDGPRDRVNLYGFASMAVAALQEQALQIELLRSELRALRENDQLACQSPPE